MCSLTDIFTNRMSRQAIYMRQQLGHAKFEFTNDRFSRDAVYNATQLQILVDAYYI